MGAPAGVVNSSQVTSPNGPSSVNQGGSVNQPSTWAWAWFGISLAFLVFSYLGRGVR